ncbi:hypothetical protein ACQPYK_37370 [Streptosporangium sp. CA-135522]|uniref:hypothetical protein n=1 Tax=Streptosporangium sp. CA-135522 TaxID=3240072 RepID=UPI003D8C00D4
MKRWRPQPIHLLAFLACLICDLVAPLILGRNDDGFLVLLMLMAQMVALLAAPLLLAFALYFALNGRRQWVVAAVLTQLVLGFVTFLGGARPLHISYLTVLGRPVEAVIADTTQYCGKQVTGQDAATGPYVCTTFLQLRRPDGSAVAGGDLFGGDAESESPETVPPSDSITVLEDRLGLVRPIPADPRTGWPVMSDFGRVHVMVLVICWIAFAASLATAITSGLRRPRADSATGAADEASDGTAGEIPSEAPNGDTGPNH